jgi:hypothetical protein
MYGIFFNVGVPTYDHDAILTCWLGKYETNSVTSWRKKPHDLVVLLFFYMSRWPTVHTTLTRFVQIF